jgi:hypothetical protein
LVWLLMMRMILQWWNHWLIIYPAALAKVLRLDVLMRCDAPNQPREAHPVSVISVASFWDFGRTAYPRIS